MKTTTNDFVIAHRTDNVVETHEGMYFPPELRSSPGEILAEELEERGISVASFTLASGLTLAIVDCLFEGIQPITQEIADGIAAGRDGISATTWLNLDLDYRS